MSYEPRSLQVGDPVTFDVAELPPLDYGRMPQLDIPFRPDPGRVKTFSGVVLAVDGCAVRVLVENGEERVLELSQIRLA